MGEYCLFVFVRVLGGGGGGGVGGTYVVKLWENCLTVHGDREQELWSVVKIEVGDRRDPLTGFKHLQVKVSYVCLPGVL